MLNKRGSVLEKTISVKETFVSKMDFKKVDLKASNVSHEHIFLEENLHETLLEKLGEMKSVKSFEDIEEGYSFSYSQRDGFHFKGVIVYKNVGIRIKQETHFYQHSNTCSHYVLSYKGKDVVELTEKQEQKAEAIVEEWKVKYHALCKEMELLGYSIIEEDDKQEVLNAGFKEFLLVNDISLDLELWDLSYYDNETEAKKYLKKPINICESGDSYINGLWIEDFKIKISVVHKVVKEEEIIKQG